MCGRITLKTSSKELASLFDGLNFSAFDPRYNICPTQTVPCIRDSGQPDSSREVVGLRWGLVPFWAKDLKIGASMINARSETVASKPAFRAAFKKRRCLVIADGFYEWKKEGATKRPFFISRHDSQAFALAGLWESWTDPDSKSSIETCTILTTTANETMLPLHDRMPVFLGPKNFDAWLDADFENTAHLESLLVPCASDDLQTWEVDTIVNKPINDSPACIEPIEARPRQTNLF